MSELKETLEHIKQIELHLVELGIEPGRVNEILTSLQELTDLRDNALKQRSTQFHDDAYELAVEIKAGHKSAQVAAFLRRFAEHVVHYALPLAKEHQGVEELVDHIPQLSESEGSNE